MLYMVEMNLPLPERDADFQAWYNGHIRHLLTLPGFLTAQRFRAVTPTPPPWLAVYTLAAADTLESPEYRAKAGPASTGEWRTIVDNWNRNLMSGLAEMPEVMPDQRLVMIDRFAAEAPPLPERFARLSPAGLDRSVVERGIAVEAADATMSEAGAGPSRRTSANRPISARLPGAPG